MSKDKVMEANADKDYAEQCLKYRKTYYVKLRYQNPKHVLEGSDVKYFLSKYCKSTLPVHMELSLMLRYNAKYWDIATVAAVVGKVAEDVED